MKTKFVRNGRTHRREMLLAAQRGETLSVKQADKLAGGPSALLLDFSHETQRGTGAPILHYDVEGLWSLRTYLSKRAMSVDELVGLMQATLDVLDLCAERRMHAEGLLFDPESVFVDAQCSPRFALVPLEGVPFQTRNSPLALLSAIADVGKLRFASPDARGVSRRLSDLIVDLDGVFSINRFRRFVEMELGQDDSLPASGRVADDPATGSVWASAGGAAGRNTSDDGSLFWSPLAGFAEETERKEPPASEPDPEPPVASMPQIVPVAPVVAEPAPVPQSMPEPASALKPDPQTPRQPASAAAEVPLATATLVRPATGERFALPLGQQVRLGRGSACDVRLLGNRKLSRVHGALTFAGQMIVVSDLGAANGIFIDGQRVASMQSVLMTPGQRLRLADEEFDVLTA